MAKLAAWAEPFAAAQSRRWPAALLVAAAAAVLWASPSPALAALALALYSAALLALAAEAHADVAPPIPAPTRAPTFAQGDAPPPRGAKAAAPAGDAGPAGHVRFAARAEGEARTAIAVSASLTEDAPAAPPRVLWFGVELQDGDYKAPSRAFRATVGGLLGLARRFMKCEVRYGLSGTPFIVFDAAHAAERFELWGADGVVEPPLEAADGSPSVRPAASRDADSVLKRLFEARESSFLALSWYTKFVDFAAWKIVELPALFGREMALTRLWGDAAMRLVLFSEDDEGSFLRAVGGALRAYDAASAPSSASPDDLVVRAERRRRALAATRWTRPDARKLLAPGSLYDFLAAAPPDGRGAAALVEIFAHGWIAGRISVDDGAASCAPDARPSVFSSGPALADVLSFKSVSRVDVCLDPSLPGLGVATLATPHRRWRVALASVASLSGSAAVGGGAAVAAEAAPPRRRLLVRGGTGALYRWSARAAGHVDGLHEFAGPRVVLNRFCTKGDNSSTADVAALPGRALALLLDATAGDDLGVLEEALEACAALRSLDGGAVSRLRGAEATAFALNLYHVVVAHAQLEGAFPVWGGDGELRDVALLKHRVLPSVLSLADTLSRATYVVAGKPVAPADLEHGVIRKFSARAATIFSGLVVADRPCPLALAAPERRDPRLGLALHAGVAASGPARVPVYAAATLDAQLDATAARATFAARRRRKLPVKIAAFDCAAAAPAPLDGGRARAGYFDESGDDASSTTTDVSLPRARSASY
ncbi:hypothetical protein JL720_1643 [Aureococcus anophagefferens]|nr:hypothetical protein JL720_1643 [Aureococcus anophagefferens]